MSVGCTPAFTRKYQPNRSSTPYTQSQWKRMRTSTMAHATMAQAAPSHPRLVPLP
ncbi:unannotated protein [freshwater metagenome]|uniref:Unannotated protein n=1 Tax=freshwater metagenome TaxID=449393 RepID=A0A6J6QLN0_9ZZZZ